MATTLLSRSGIFSDIQQSKKTLHALNHQRHFSQFCDVVLRVCGTEIYAHSSVLAAASPYFSSFLGMGSDCPRAFSQKQPQVIEIHIDSISISEGDGGYGEAVYKVVEYMYTNEITITTNVFSQIIEIGRIMLLDQLLGYCDEFQKGIDGNGPKTVSTCTSTLIDVVNILRTSVKGVRKADAQTETEESVFAKVTSNVVPVDHSSQSVDFGLLFNKKPSVDDVPVTDAKIRISVCDDSIEAANKFSASDNSRIIMKTTPKEESQNAETSNGDDVEQDNSTSIEMKDAQSLPQDPEPEENFNAIKSFEDILDYENSISVGQSSDMINEAAAPGSDFIEEKLNSDQSLTANLSQISGTVTDVELEDISDLVTFKSVTSSSYNKKPGRGRPRGQQRKRRGRGRPKGKRKVDNKGDNNPDSDYEFEQLIHKLEKGGDKCDYQGRVEAHGKVSSVSTLTQCQQTDKKDKNVPLHQKKSNRIRSRPSQLQKDYILHSLGRKTRRIDDSMLHEKDGGDMHTVDEATKSVESGLRFLCQSQSCDFSTKVFKDYVSHLNSHPETDPNSFLCQKCGFKTTKSKLFKIHKENHMVEDLICVFCEFQSSNITEYKEHALKHSGDLPYFCHECDARFKRKSQLESHQPKHWLTKPFICPICKAGFKWKHALKNHMITHTTVKDHLCDICGYATAHKSMLTSHRLSHTGETFKCSVDGCGFEGTKRQKLKMHMVTHTREKPHQCEVCGQRFSLAKNMRRHLLLHTNTRPFACKICSFSTTRYDKLKEHNHKLHNIGGPPVCKKEQTEDVVSVNKSYGPPTATIVTAEDIALNPDGTISAESLKKIAEMATAQQNEVSLEETTINIEQPDSHSNNVSIIAHIQYSQPSLGEEESIQFI